MNKPLVEEFLQTLVDVDAEVATACNPNANDVNKLVVKCGSVIANRVLFRGVKFTRLPDGKYEVFNPDKFKNIH